MAARCSCSRTLTDRRLLGRQLCRAFGPLLGVSEEESLRGVDVGFRVLDTYEADLGRRAREVLDRLEHEARLGIVLLARPYHHDPGLNHGILDEFQTLGYPVLSQSTLPIDEDLLDRLFADDRRRGVVESPRSISDVWKNSTSASTNRKLWAAKFVARHPNLVALELSSFKCGHDAPVYAAIESIVEQSGTPYFAFKDIDENKATGSVKIRIETIHYFLARHRADIIRRSRSTVDIAHRIDADERERRDLIARENALTRPPAAPVHARHQKIWPLRPVVLDPALQSPGTACGAGRQNANR